jgi:hypothetical protein
VSQQADHLIVAADTLDDGVAWCEAALGVTPAPGGRHEFMGTHNRLVNLSSAAFPRCYLEIIAIDPAAPSPGRARWFGLDERPPGPPRLWHWVARTSDLARARQALVEQGLDPGEAVAASRGDLRWQILLRADGRVLPDRPTLIQWFGPHPAERLPDAGLRLLHLDSAAGLAATLDTPRGPQTLIA